MNITRHTRNSQGLLLIGCDIIGLKFNADSSENVSRPIHLYTKAHPKHTQHIHTTKDFRLQKEEREYWSLISNPIFVNNILAMFFGYI